MWTAFSSKPRSSVQANKASILLPCHSPDLSADEGTIYYGRMTTSQTNGDKTYRDATLEKAFKPLIHQVAQGLIEAMGGVDETLKNLRLLGHILCETGVAKNVSDGSGFQLVKMKKLDEAISQFLDRSTMTPDAGVRLSKILLRLWALRSIAAGMQNVAKMRGNSNYPEFVDSYKKLIDNECASAEEESYLSAKHAPLAKPSCFNKLRPSAPEVRSGQATSLDLFSCPDGEDLITF